MSSYSFSHQFYQHWTGAPEPVRAAIVQELTDITDLLQTQTAFEKFVFSIHDLDAHLDDLYCAYDLEQLEIKKVADEKAALEAEQHLQEQRKIVQAAQEEENLRQREMAKKRQAEQAKAEAEAAAQNSAENTSSDESTVNMTVELDNKDKIHENMVSNNSGNDTNSVPVTSTSSINAVSATINQAPAIDLSLADIKLNATHENMIRELEMHIEDYLTEQMLKMSENLKAWLRSEVSRQLADKEPAIENNVEK